jgi:hypothetical protein
MSAKQVVDLMAMLEQDTNVDNGTVVKDAGPVTAKAGLSIVLEGIPDLRKNVDAVFDGTPLEAYASEWSESDPSRNNYALAWVHAWVQFVAASLATAVKGKLVERGGTHRKANLSKGLAAKLAGAVVASAKSGRLVNIQVGPPTGLHKCDPIAMVDPEVAGAIDGGNVQAVLRNIQQEYRGAKHPVGLIALLKLPLLHKAEEVLSYDNIYAKESKGVIAMLEDFQTRRGFWKELKQGSAAAGGDIVWDSTLDQDDNVAWGDLDHILRGRLIWAGRKGGWGPQALPVNSESAMIYNRKERIEKSSR